MTITDNLTPNMLYIWTFHTKGKSFKLADNANLVTKGQNKLRFWTFQTKTRLPRQVFGSPKVKISCVSEYFRQKRNLKKSKWPPQAHRASYITHLQYQPTPYRTQ